MEIKITKATDAKDAIEKIIEAINAPNHKHIRTPMFLIKDQPEIDRIITAHEEVKKVFAEKVEIIVKKADDMISELHKEDEELKSSKWRALEKVLLAKGLLPKQVADSLSDPKSRFGMEHKDGVFYMVETALDAGPPKTGTATQENTH